MSLSAIGLFLTAPVMLVCAILIKMQDWGPIFYAQERMGLDGKRFMILKFRSMRVNAESSTGPVWAIREDDRRTRGDLPAANDPADDRSECDHGHPDQIAVVDGQGTGLGH